MGILVKGGTVIDGTGSPPVPGGAVLIDGTKIVRVGPERQVAAGASDRIVDAEGGTIIPGMINLHDHIHRRMIRFPRVGSSYREHSDRLEKDPDSFVVLLAAYCQLIQLRTGVTTVRDIGCRSYFTIDLRRAIDEGKIPGPRLSVAGKFISMTGGHGANGREADGPDEVRKAAREQLGAGADFLKLMATGGILNFPDEDGVLLSIPRRKCARRSRRRTNRGGE
jgi:imidazolonepropionase-like amidohydrolase